jgi:two-component system LytT family sensor kinase
MPQVAIENASSRGNLFRLPTIVLAFLVWTLVACLSYLRYYLRDPNIRLWPDAFIWLDCFYPWALLTPLVFGLEKRFPLGPARLARNVAVLLLASCGLAYVAFALSVILGVAMQFFVSEPRVLSAILGQPLAVLRLCVVRARLWPIPSDAFWIHGFLCWCTFGASCVLRRFSQLHERERDADRLALEKSKLEFSLKQAELEALRMRLNPHFLFNTLQNISVLAQQDPKTASQMITRLGDLLRTAFRRDAQPEVTLETEMGLTQAYVDVERMRFRERLSVRVEMAPGTEQSMVPTFLLQPLVENAIKHGLSELRTSGQIQIRSTKEEDRLVLSVSDNGTGLTAENLQQLELGVGLGSTCERLARMYPEKHELAVRKLSEGGTEVRVVLPFRLNVAPA